MKYKQHRANRGQRNFPHFPQYEQLENRALLAAVITVNSTLDSNVRDNFLTLRESILVSNRTLAVATLSAAEQAQVSGSPTNADTDTIGFNIPGAGVQSISTATALPALTDPAIVDGYTQPGASANTLAVGNDAVLQIELNGSGTVGTALFITSGSSTVRGFVMNRFTRNAIELQNGSGNTIQGNWMGLMPDGVTLAANGDELGSTGYDIFISNNSSNNTIGGTAPAARNVFEGNDEDGAIGVTTGTGTIIQGNYIGTNSQGTAGLGAGGLHVGSDNNLVGGTNSGARNVMSGAGYLTIGIIDGPASNNMIQGNYVGLNASGTAALANNVGGVLINGQEGNLIGGTTAAARNVIVTTGIAGIRVSGPGPTTGGNTIQGNYVGTNAAGTTLLVAPGNLGYFGILVEGGKNNLVGGTIAGAGNVIAGYYVGVSLGRSDGPDTFGNVVQGNFVGTDATGMVALGNGVGIELFGPEGVYANTIGGTAVGARNVISGNRLDGIYIGSDGDPDLQPLNIFQGNFIGVAADGISPLGNGTDNLPGSNNGIFVQGIFDSQIGGTNANEGNIIAFNAGAGVANFSDVFGTPIAILGNSIFSNAGLGIDLVAATDPASGVTPNDPGDADIGGNNLQNYPVITSVTTGGTTTINGTLNSTANGTFRVELFVSAAADPSGFGEGQTYLGFTTVTTDGSGNGSFSFSPAVAVPAGQFITSTATDAAGNTSEFSGVRIVTVQPTLSINDLSLNEGVSGITAYTFTVTLSANPSSNVTVAVNTANGTTNPATTADNDYSAITNQVLTFVPNGSLTQTVTVNVTGDSKFERNETFFVNLSSPTGATLANSQGLGTIQNDDLAPTLTFSTSNSVLEGNAAADDRKVPFTVTLSAVSGVDVSGTINTISGTATEGTDFVSADGVAFVIPAGQTQATILVSVIEDTTVELDEQFTITATATDLTTIGNTNGAASGTGAILNDDSTNGPTVMIGPGCHGPALIINGSSASDTIRVVLQGQNAVKVLINGQNYGTFAFSTFQEIIAYGKGGNDDIELVGNICTPAYLFGENGNDRLKGGNGPNVLVGGNGCDNLIGGAGADVLIGGDGSDQLVGNGGDDLLVAGWTDHDSNIAALCAILDEWSRTDASYFSRVNHLQFGGGLNGSVRLNNLTVHDDGDFDKLTGSAGCDWFFANWCGGVLDQITDRHPTERVDDIN